MARMDEKIGQACGDKLSETIFNVMFCMYPNNKTLRMNRNSILVTDFLRTLRFEGKLSTYTVGSKGEGTAVAKSDEDELILFEKIMLFHSAEESSNVWEKIMVCQGDERVTDQNCVVFVLDRTDCRPGYTKLKLLQNDTIERCMLRSEGKIIMDMVEKTENGYYLLNEKVIRYFLHVLKTSGIPLKVFRHGPCATAVYQSKYDYMNEDIPDTDHDYAQGFEMNSMTSEGKDFLRMMDTSKTKRCWPPAKTIEKIKTYKCEVVAVGDQDQKIPNSSLKWRISYTLWERELIWSFQDVEYFCFVILKNLLQQKIRSISDDVTTYHIKNVLFWEALDRTQELLQGRDLLCFLQKCLVRLRNAIFNKRLDHFIDRNRNLFESKLKDENSRLKLINFLDGKLGTFTNIVPDVIELLELDELKELWRKYRSDPVKLLTQINIYAADFALQGSNEKLIRCAEIKSRAVIVLEIKSDICATTNEVLDMFINNFDAMVALDVDNEFLELVKRMILFYHGFKSACSCGGKKFNDIICFLQANYTDALSDRLYVCTSLVLKDMFQEAAHIIDEFLCSSPKLLIYCGQCSDCFGIYVKNGNALQVKFTETSISDYEIPRYPFPVVLDVIVDYLNCVFFPPAIQIQIFYERYIYLNPVVYMNYLKVLCDISGNKNTEQALQKLRESVYQCGLERDNFRHLNLMGHAYLLTKKYKQAYRCFMESIRDNVSRMVPSSVFYLLVVMIHQILYPRSGNEFPDVSVLYTR